MTIYRAQLKLLSAALNYRPQVEILTADRFQGRDKDCIIISLVRSNSDRASGLLLKDWRRVNVAVTRARAKLIVFGGQSTLSEADSIKDFVALVKRENWVYDLSQDCLAAYDFEKVNVAMASRQTPVVKITRNTTQKYPVVSNILADLGN